MNINLHFTTNLLKWYNSKDYNFPWRNCQDPYKTWLSEIMLQQTQVKIVIPYFNRWIQIFPNLNSVASAHSESILKQWEGLGYYARARNFYKACKIVNDVHMGEIPKDYSTFLMLPGVGPYIAGAVLSIAFNNPIPAVDSNAHRVVSRLYEIPGVFNKSKGEIKDVLSSVISKKNPGDFNQALMDLGREICIPTQPKCNICPVVNYCNAHINNSINSYPSKIQSKKKPHYNIGVGIIWNKGKILIAKRKENGFLGGLWEFPGGKLEKGENITQWIIREVNEELGIQVQPTSLLKQIKHTYSHFSITMDAYNCDYLHGTPHAIGCDKWQWIWPKDILKLPFPKANHKLFDQLIEKSNQC